MDNLENLPETESEQIEAKDGMDIAILRRMRSYSLTEEENESVKIFIVSGPEFRTALSDQDKLWTDGVVPYKISNDYRKEQRDFILEAMEEFHNKTCVQFRPRRRENSYIFIQPGEGCSAGIGNIKQENRVNLVEECFVKGIVLHELMHTLGFIHEQNRPDRDDFVTINFDNIREGAEGNFNKWSSNDVTSFNQTYDYGSVMHYGMFEFAKNKSVPTITPREKGVEIGQRRGFSEKDLLKINLLYNCTERTQN